MADQPSTAGLDACLSATANVAGLETVGCRAGTLPASPRALALSANGAQLYVGGSTRVDDPPARGAADSAPPRPRRVVAGTAGAVPLACTGPERRHACCARSRRRRPRARSGAIDQAAGTVAYTGNATFSGADALGLHAPPTACSPPRRPTAAPSPRPRPAAAARRRRPSSRSTRATVQGVVWRRSKLIAGSIVVRRLGRRTRRPRASPAPRGRARRWRRRPRPLPRRARLHLRRGRVHAPRAADRRRAHPARAASSSRSAAPGARSPSPRRSRAWCAPRVPRLAQRRRGHAAARHARPRSSSSTAWRRCRSAGR